MALRIGELVVRRDAGQLPAMRVLSIDSDGRVNCDCGGQPARYPADVLDGVREFFMDVLPDSQNTYRVIVYALGRTSIPPLDGVTVETFFKRIQQVLVWPDENIQHLRNHLMQDGKLVNERMGLVSLAHLHRLEFEASPWN